MKWYFLVIVLLVGCSASDSVKVGVLLPLSGDFASPGFEVQEGILSVETEVEFIFEDTQCDVVETVTAYNKLTSIDGVQYIIGPLCGSPQEIVAHALTDQLALFPTAAPEELSEFNVFQIQYSLEKDGQFIAEQILSEGYTSVALISYKNAFSESLANGFLESFEGEIYEHIIIDENVGDILTAVLKIKGADAVYIADLTFFMLDGLDKMKEQGVEMPVYSFYGVQFEFVQGLVNGVHYSYPVGVSDSTLVSLGHDSAQVLVDAISFCSDEFSCVLEQLDSFDREIEMRQIGSDALNK